MPGFIKEPVTSPANACINNMRQIDGAINEWALEKGKTNGTVVTANDITNYVKLNQYGKIPPCPSGGKYTYGKVGDIPQISCSLSTDQFATQIAMSGSENKSSEFDTLVRLVILNAKGNPPKCPQARSPKNLAQGQILIKLSSSYGREYVRTPVARLAQW